MTDTPTNARHVSIEAQATLRVMQETLHGLSVDHAMAATTQLVVDAIRRYPEALHRVVVLAHITVLDTELLHPGTLPPEAQP